MTRIFSHHLAHPGTLISVLILTICLISLVFL